MKKRVAVWMHGGIGTGHFSQGYPALEKLLNGLSSSFEIVVYSKFPINENYRSDYFTIRPMPKGIRSGVVRWLYMCFSFLKDQRKNKFDLLLAFWGYPGGFLATCLSRIVKIPCAVYLLGSDSFGIASINFGILHKPVLRRIAFWTYRRATLLLGISEFQNKNLTAHGINNVIVIPWGIEKNNYEFRPRSKNSEVHFIHIGHISPVKDQVTLLKAFALIAQQRSSKLRIYGSDLMNGAIQRIARGLGIESHVQFLDLVPYHQMPELYAWANVMLHTSLVEGQSMALTEAAASGTLLAGTRVGLLHDLGDDCGIIVDVGDFEGLASKIINILDEHESWDRKIRNARHWAEAHDLSWTVNELTSRFNTVINSRR